MFQRNPLLTDKQVAIPLVHLLHPETTLCLFFTRLPTCSALHTRKLSSLFTGPFASISQISATLSSIERGFFWVSIGLAMRLVSILREDGAISVVGVC